MELNFTTPSLLFPAISLLLLAYTNRFLAIANLIRKLHDEYISGQKNKLLLHQIKGLRTRINLIRYMQGLGVFSFLLCVVCMYCIYIDRQKTAGIIFTISSDFNVCLGTIFIPRRSLCQFTHPPQPNA